MALYPDDKMVAEVYLGLGDLATSDVDPDSQPTFEQISEAQKITQWYVRRAVQLALSLTLLSMKGIA